MANFMVSGAGLGLGGFWVKVVGLYGGRVGRGDEGQIARNVLNREGDDTGSAGGEGAAL
jgi:hypothetical protein